MTLNVIAASDCFTQDIEDLPEELRPGVDTETGEITGKQKPTIPSLSDAEFEKQMPRWKAAVEAGKKDADAIIAFVNAQNIAVMTDAQKAIINGWKKVEPEAKAEPEQKVTGNAAIDPDDIPFD